MEGLVGTGIMIFQIKGDTPNRTSILSLCNIIIVGKDEGEQGVG